MLSVSIKHPDSEAFIDAKMTEGKVTGANVSVKLEDVYKRQGIYPRHPNRHPGPPCPVQ